MKPLVFLQRRRQRAAPKIALFPFLAVLICTMGALVPLLLAMARQARLSAAREAAARTAERSAEVSSDRDSAVWRVEQLKASRQQTLSQVEDARVMLGHVEDHTRRLQQQIVQLKGQYEALEKTGVQDSAEREALAAEWQRLQRQLAAAGEQIEAAKTTVGRKPRSFAIVPYVGPNRTYRRPMYLECTAKAVILQPEGVYLTAEDLEGPTGPGCPLLAMLRAVREHWVVNGGFDPDKDGEPYPLLLVRPEGAAAYHVARKVLQNWSSDFGYELIGADWKLAFPPPDPRLIPVTQTALAHARAVQARDVASAPRAYRGARRNTSAGSPRGDAGGGVGGPGGPYPAQPGGHVGSHFDGGGDGGPPTGYGGVAATVPGGASGSSGSRRGSPRDVSPESLAAIYGGGDAPSGGMPGPGLPSYGAGRGGMSAGGGTGPGTGIAGGPGGGSAPSAAAGGGSVFGSGSPSSQGMAGGPAFGPGGGSGLPGGGTLGTAGVPSPQPGYGTAGGGTSGGGPGVGSAAAAGPQLGAAQGTGGAGDGHARRAAQQVSDRQQQRRQAARRLCNRSAATIAPASTKPAGPATEMAPPMRPGEWQERPPHVEPPKEDETKKKDKDKLKKRIDKDQQDWGLPTPGPKASGIARPIHIDLYTDRVVVAPTNTNRTVALPPRSFEATDELVAAVWNEMESWGIAGRGMYWRPVLSVHVAPGADARFAELQQMLNGSGITIEKK